MIPVKETIFEEGQTLLFDKPLYWTSFDLVNKVRILIKSILGIRNIKAGHAGTLDPLATGLMIICTGRATKRIEDYSNLDKEYIGTIRLGETTASYDLETEVNDSYPVDHITEDLIKYTLTTFLGEYKQVPPIHSAKLINGKRAYEYARKGVGKELEPVTVYFRELELLYFNLPEVRVRIVCSKGTYIRSFARDLGITLGSGAYLSALVRTAIGHFNLENAFSLEKFENFIKEMKQI